MALFPGMVFENSFRVAQGLPATPSARGARKIPSPPLRPQPGFGASLQDRSPPRNAMAANSLHSAQSPLHEGNIQSLQVAPADSRTHGSSDAAASFRKIFGPGRVARRQIQPRFSEEARSALDSLLAYYAAYS